jgi:hypothetical protein
MTELKVFFYVDQEAMLPAAVAAAEALRKASENSILLVLPDSEAHVLSCRAGYNIYKRSLLIGPERPAHPEGAPGSAFSRRREAATRLARRMAREARTLASWRGAVNRIDVFLRDMKPDAIVLFEDNIQNFTRIVVEQGRRRGIPSIILPYTIPNPAEAATFYRDDPDHLAEGALTRLLLRRNPNWRLDHGGRQLLRLPARKAWTLELLGFASRTPWILNSGDAAFIALDSEAMRRLYLRLGFPSDQLRVIGDPASDDLVEGLARKGDLLRKLYTEQRLPDGRPLVVCGFPPDQYARGARPGYEFASFDSLVENWMRAFTSLGNLANVLVRPHPRLEPQALLRYATETVRVTTAPTARLIPSSDLYVAASSATIRWAIACGVPAVNYDTYRFDYDDFADAPGVLTTSDIAGLRALLGRFAHDANFRAQMQDRQRSVMRDWGVMDGDFGARLAALLREAVNSQRTRGSRHL